MLRRSFLVLSLLLASAPVHTVFSKQSSLIVTKSAISSADVPQQPYDSSTVAAFIWNVLLPELQTNMNLYPTHKAYQKAVIQLEQLYEKAVIATTGTQLGQILSQAIALASPSTSTIPPDAQEASQKLAAAQSILAQVDQSIISMQSSISGLIQKITANTAQISTLQQQIAGMANPPASAQTDLQKAQSDLAQAQSSTAQLQLQTTSLNTFKTTFDQSVQDIASIANQIINGNNPNGVNLASLNNLYNALLQSQNTFQQTLSDPISTQISSLNTFILTTLAPDIATLTTDVGAVVPIETAGLQTCYIDMGLLSAQLWEFMVYYPEQYLDMAKFDQYLGSLYSQFKAAGINQINLSFAQIGSIDSLVNEGKGAATDDVIAQMMANFPGALEKLISKAHSVGIKVDLAFGGENGASMKIAGAGQTVQGQAQKLVQLVEKLKLDSLDFDFESTAFTNANSPQDAQAFFLAIKQGLQGKSKPISLTVMGSLHDWPLNFLKELFFDQSGNLIFTTLFDDLNLMLYSQTEYYIDANNPSWGIEQWIDLMGRSNVSRIHIGFEDNVNYANPHASAGGTYQIDTTNPGTAAAEIYLQLLQKLDQDGYPNQLGQTFFWPDINHHAPGTWSRYQVINNNGAISVNFDTDVIQAFYNKLISSH